MQYYTTIVNDTCPTFVPEVIKVVKSDNFSVFTLQNSKTQISALECARTVLFAFLEQGRSKAVATEAFA